MKELQIPEPFLKMYYHTSASNPGIKIPDPILRKVSDIISNESREELLEISNELWRHYSYGFVGMSAPQVGYSKRMIIVGAKNFAPELLINPEIIDADGSQFCDEGCMSVPGLFGNVERSYKIQIKAMNLEGKNNIYCFEGFPAVVAQHEIDHLNGKLFYDVAIQGTLQWRHIDKWKEYLKLEIL